jgi:DNA repair protein RadC
VVNRVERQLQPVRHADPEDKALTNRLAEAATILGLDLLDHIVIGHERYVSFKEAGLMG